MAGASGCSIVIKGESVGLRGLVGLGGVNMLLLWHDEMTTVGIVNCDGILSRERPFDLAVARRFD
jgi:hypothetical protein